MNKLLSWIPAIIVMAAIFALSSVPGNDLNAVGLGKPSIHTDGHFMMFLVLCLAYYKATKNIFHSIMLSILFAVSDETHQLFTPLRTSHFIDIFTDTFGAMIAGGLIWKLYPILSKKLRNLLAK